MKSSVLFLFLLFATTVSSQVTLPAYRNGSWWLINNEKNIELPKGIEYIGLFDSKNRALFIQQNKYGIIDQNGQTILEPKYRSISSFGFGLFNCIDSVKNVLLDVESGKEILNNCNVISDLNENYLLVEQDSSNFLIHKASKQIFVYPDSLEFETSYLNTILINLADGHSVFHHANGTKYPVSNDSIDYTRNYIIIKQQNEVIFITGKKEITLNPKISKISVYNNQLSYFDGKNAHLINLETNSEILKLPYHQIHEAYFGGYFVTLNESTGWINDKFQLKIPVKYDYISRLSNGYEVHKDGMSGWIDSNFQMKLPCEFNYFSSQGNFITVSSMVGTRGLFSNLTNKMLFAPIYDKISINNNLIKAYVGNKIRIVELSPEHRILKDLVLDNAVTALQSNSSDHKYRFDKRVLPLGWYYERTDLYDSNQNLTGYKYLWGLKNESDSMLISARLKQPVFVPNMPFSIFSKGLEIYSICDDSEVRSNVYEMRSHETGKLMNDLEVVQLDTIDCYTRSFMRFETTDGYKLWYDSDSIVDINHINTGSAEFLEFCVGGKPIYLTEKEKESVSINHYSLNGNNRSYSCEDRLTKKYFSQVKYEGAKWNYLNREGQKMFAEDFEFANPFYKETAIARRKSGQGVVNKDTIIIPFKFSDIRRIPQFNDTVFMVTLPHHKRQYLDSNAELQANANSFVRSIGDLVVVNKNKKYAVLKNGEFLAEELDNVSLIDDHSYYVRRGKIFDVNNDNTLFEISYKPEKFVGDDFVVVQKAAKNGLVNYNNEILIPIASQEIEEMGSFIVQTVVKKVIVYSSQLTLLYESEPGEFVYVDPFTNQFAVIVNGKVSIYNHLGERILKFSQPDQSAILAFQNGLLVSKESIFNATTKFEIPKNSKIDLLDSGFIAVYDGITSIVFFNSLSAPVMEQSGKNCRYLGEDVFSFNTKKGILLRNNDVSILLGSNSIIKSHFNDGMCLVQVNKEYIFYTSDLKNAFNRSFIDAMPFFNQMCTVRDKEGWTIMDHNGILKSYPSFNKIIQVSRNLFETIEKTTYGLYDSHGKELIPPIYEKITIVTPEIIQVIKNGEIGYLSINGNALFAID